MSRPRIAAPISGVAFFVLLLLVLLPALSFAQSSGAPPPSAATRSVLIKAADGHSLLPWQRQVMRNLAGRSAPPAQPTRTNGVDGTWSQLPPPMVQETPAVYDPQRHSMLFFGGRSSGNENCSDTWELALAGTPAWTLLQTGGQAPPPRSGHVAMFDSRRERLLIFGGADSIARNDAWALDLTQNPPHWGPALPTGALPARRAYCQAVYDSLNDRAIIFGGADSVSDQGPVSLATDMWAMPFSGGSAYNWSLLTPAGTPPSPRAGGTVIYDRARQRLVLFGGFDGGVLADAFTLSLGGSPAWAPLGASGGPPAARAIPAVVYDQPHDRMVIFSGLGDNPLTDVWALDLGSNAWTELSPTGGPPSARQFSASVYDVPQNRMVIFSGNDDNGAVTDPLWSLSLGPSVAWTDLGGRKPPRRWSAASVFDPTRHLTWVQGGQGWEGTGPVMRSDLWALRTMTIIPEDVLGWSQPATTGTPLGKRFGHTGIYDASRDRLVFFGGNDSTSNRNDVWVVSGLGGTPAWSQLSPAGTPPAARMNHSAVYDAVNDRMIVFGGYSDQSLNDVWALDFAGTPTWTQLSPTGSAPPTLWMQSAALDAQGNRLIVFGGRSFGLRNDVYALTLTGSPVWSQLSPTGTLPAPREQASMASTGSGVLLYGGNIFESGQTTTDDTWMLNLYPTPAWHQLDVGSTTPPAREAGCAAFDPANRTLAIFGGTGMNTEGGDTWLLQVDQLVPALASLVSANAEAGRVALAWEVSSASSATIYRRNGDGPWAALASATPDGTGRIAYVDRDVTAGARYGYRLGLADPGGEVFAGEVWVDVPQSALFALRGMQPNPAPGAGLIAFSLPDATPARLEVVDVTGRQLFSAEVGTLGRGEHFVRLGDGRPLAPGLYLVRLTRAGRSLTAKAVTVR